MSTTLLSTAAALVLFAGAIGIGIHISHMLRARAEALARFIEWRAWEGQLAAGGWRHWLDDPPADGILIEALRHGWDVPHIHRAGSEPPWTNRNGLWWRPWQATQLQELVTRIEGMRSR